MEAINKVIVQSKYPWGIVDACGAEYIISKGGSTSDYTVYLDFSEIVEQDRNNTEKCIEKLADAGADGALSFNGWVGYWSYDFLASHMGIECKAKRDLDQLDGVFVRPRTIIHFHNDKTEIESTIPGRADELSKLNHDFSRAVPSAPENNFQSNINFDSYKKIFEKAREEILCGNTYQIKISQRYSTEAEVCPLSIFLSLMEKNPSPESFLLRMKDFSMVSCSPETVIRKSGREIMTKPIGGTWERKSGMSEEGLIARFLQNEKEVSEHNMLVDLERNDLSRICESGSVRIEKFRDIEAYSHLFHLVTTICGELREEVSWSDIIKAMLPGGSITGCPKYKTMELIDKFEPVSRGMYTGSFGLLHDNGDMHLNLIIRTMFVSQGKCHVQAGGGIIVDSNPEYEHNENLIKAKALLETVETPALQSI